MKNPNPRSKAHGRPARMGDETACVLQWIDGLVDTGIAAYDESADEFPILYLCSGEAFLLGDSAITRLR